MASMRLYFAQKALAAYDRGVELRLYIQVGADTYPWEGVIGVDNGSRHPAEHETDMRTVNQVIEYSPGKWVLRPRRKVPDPNHPGGMVYAIVPTPAAKTLKIAREIVQKANTP